MGNSVQGSASAHLTFPMPTEQPDRIGNSAPSAGRFSAARRPIDRPKPGSLKACRRLARRESAGAVAQMGERCNRTAEVRGSNPLSSTKC